MLWISLGLMGHISRDKQPQVRLGGKYAQMDTSRPGKLSAPDVET